jgi:hypothetical protein
MANPKSITNATSSATMSDHLPPLVVPYSHLPLHKQVSNEVYFAERALTISRGAKVAADILRMDVIERDAGRNPVLEINGIEALAGLLSEAMFTLSEMTEKRLDDLNCGKA